MVTARLLIEYDGSKFSGWARQPGRRSVQGEIEAAIARLRGGKPLKLKVAGRTDAGVHALGQVASHAGEPLPARALNAVLPGDVAVLSSELAPPGFDARHDALSRTYRYRILARRQPSAFERGRSLWWPYTLDRLALHECAAALPGTHDFTAFTPTQTRHVRFARTVSRARWAEVDGDILEFSIEADAFMRHMNRILVGTMLEVAGGRRSAAEFRRLLTGAHRRDGGPTAKPHGLYLVGVTYESEEGPRARLP